MPRRPAGHAFPEVIEMSHAKDVHSESLRIDPEKRLVPLYDSTGIALYPVADRRKMGMRVLSNFCEEHIM